MFYLPNFVLALSIFSALTDGYLSPNIRLIKTTDLWPLLEEHEIFQPTALVSDGDGNFFIFDDGNKIIHKFSRSYKRIKGFGVKGQGPGEFTHRVGKLAVFDRKLIALENFRKTVHFFDLTGDFLSSFVIRDIGVPHDMAIDESGLFYFTDRGFYVNREHVLLYDHDGTLLDKKLTNEHFITWAEATKKGTPREQTERVAQLLAQHYRRIAINRKREIFLGRYDKYILEKYSQDFNLLWRREMEFERQLLPYAGFYRQGTMPGALNSAEGDGAITDLKFDTHNNIFVSIGSRSSFDDFENLPLKHWIDVFDDHGNHLARLLEHDLSHSRRGYMLDIYGTRLMMLGENQLLVYNIVYE